MCGDGWRVTFPPYDLGPGGDAGPLDDAQRAGQAHAQRAGQRVGVLHLHGDGAAQHTGDLHLRHVVAQPAGAL